MRRAFILLSGIVLSMPVLAEPPLGRLFYTPTERAAMEARKSAAGAQEVTLPYQGLVLQNTGAITVWQEDVPRVLPPETAKANLWRNVGGAREELLRGGRIVVHPGK
jgi:hypothetical protein